MRWLRRHRPITLCAIGALGAIALAGCASRTAAGDAATSPPERSAQCVVAVAPNEDPPEGCVGYDPEKNMALNERFRERVEVPDGIVAAGEPYAEAATAGLAELQASGSVTAASVREVLERTGLRREAIQTLGDVGAVAFGAELPPEVGGEAVAVCLYGEVRPDQLAVEVGGIVMDGGCLAGPGGH